MKRMKRILSILLAVLLLTACNPVGRQDSENFIPSDAGSHSLRPSGGEIQPVKPGGLPGSEGDTVKTVLSYKGEIPLSQPVRYYSYELPMIDLTGSYAAACNQEIEVTYGSLIRQGLEDMENYRDPALETLRWSSFVHGGILTLRIDQRNGDGSSNTAYYTVDASTGREVSLEALGAAAGISGDLREALKAAVTERYGQLYGSGQGDSGYTTALNKTLAQLSELRAQQIHMTESGTLVAAYGCYAPQGGVSMDEVSLP